MNLGVWQKEEADASKIPPTSSDSYTKWMYLRSKGRTSRTTNLSAPSEQKNSTRFTVDGGRINYPVEVATPTADMMVAKILFNSVVSTRGEIFMTIDISNFYLMTPLKRPEYIRLKLTDISKDIIDDYSLNKKSTADGSIYIESNKGMYGLPQTGLLANDLLDRRLNKHGYRQSKLVTVLWKHDWRPVQFTLVVNDFGVKYVGKEHALHLKQVIKENYGVTTDWAGAQYIVITIEWDSNHASIVLAQACFGGIDVF